MIHIYICNRVLARVLFSNLKKKQPWLCLLGKKGLKTPKHPYNGISKFTPYHNTHIMVSLSLPPTIGSAKFENTMVTPFFLLLQIMTELLHFFLEISNYTAL